MTETQSTAVNATSRLAEEYAQLKMAHVATRLQMLRYAQDLNVLSKEKQFLEEKLRFLLGGDAAWDTLQTFLKPGSSDCPQAYVLTDKHGEIGVISEGLMNVLGDMDEPVPSHIQALASSAQRKEIHETISALSQELPMSDLDWQSELMLGKDSIETRGKAVRFSVPADRQDLLAWKFRASNELTNSQQDVQELHRLFAQSEEGLLVLNTQGIILSVNAAMTRCLGFAEQELQGKTCDCLCLDAAVGEVLVSKVKDSSAQGMLQCQGWLAHKENAPVYSGLSIMPWKNMSNDYWLLWVQDLSLAHHVGQRMVELACHDAMTGLLQRAEFISRLDAEIRQCASAAEHVFVLLVDLDRFKFINDSLGQEVGDELLREASRRILTVASDDIFVGRVGADEFAVCIPTHNSDPEFVSQIGFALVQTMAQPFLLGTQEVFCTASVGTAQSPGDGKSGVELLQMAERAVLLVKTRGGNGMQSYLREFKGHSYHRLMLEAHLRYAIERDELQIHYQPLVHAVTGELKGAEALLRWHSPTLHDVSPIEFIPIAEETGLIVQIGIWVMVEACQQARIWRHLYGDDFRISVNVSSQQLHRPDFAESVRYALDTAGLPPNGLELEITESGLIDHSFSTLNALRTLRNLGVSIALDDFGTGYSSLSRIQQLPINRIKIDRSFVQYMMQDPHATSLIAAIIVMAREMNLELTAEGIEDAEQATYLRDAGCQVLQGFYFGKPKPALRFGGKCWAR